MSFRVHSTVVNNTTLVHLTDNNHSTGVTIIPEAGAMLHEFIIPVDGQPFNIIENYSLDRPVREQVTHYFRSVKLSPWVCRLADGRYELKGKIYQIQRMYTDGTALHGLLFDQTFSIVSQHAGNDSATLTLQHDYTGYDAGYPFPYRCEVRYVLMERGMLKVETKVTNTGTQIIPVSDGWHPYFKLGGKVDDWELQFNSEAMVEFDERLIPTGKMLPYERFRKPERIGGTVMDNCFLLDFREGEIACTLRNPANNIEVDFVPGAPYFYLQLFIPDHRQSIAIENLASTPDSFNNHRGGTELAPGQTWNCRLHYIARQLPRQKPGKS